MGLGGMMARIPAAAKRNASLWLSQGISPRRLALTLALGFAVGCIPVVGIPTVLCAGLALVLRLNLPAIQMANYAAMPLQLILIVPFVRLGAWLVSARHCDNISPCPPRNFWIACWSRHWAFQARSNLKMMCVCWQSKRRGNSRNLQITNP